jgi:hypothetical protein
MDSLTLDARRSAVAVRDLLNRAEAELGDILESEGTLRVVLSSLAVEQLLAIARDEPCAARKTVPCAQDSTRIPELAGT